MLLFVGGQQEYCLLGSWFVLVKCKARPNGWNTESERVGIMMNSSVNLKTSKYNVTIVKLRSRFSML